VSYRSKTEMLGLPLVHVARPRIVDGYVQRGVARGWIAVGDISFGILVSVGGLAFGGIAIGGVGIGILTLAGLAVGVGMALGGLAIGGVAIGGCAIAWKAALGGAAIAKEFAIGGSAIAEHANDDAARHFFEETPARYGKAFVDHAHWFLLLTLLPFIFRRRKGSLYEER
jgi:hypothetical protein